MTKLIDANIILRFLLNDVPDKYQTVVLLFKKAKSGKLTLIVLTVTIFEVVYVLERKYKFDRTKIAHTLINFLSAEGVSIDDIDVVIKALVKYKETKIDLQDIYLFFYALKHGMEIISFDKDFAKLSKISSS